MTKKKGKPAGVLIRGADGKLYFIPDAQLKQFALPPKHQEIVSKARHKGKALLDIALATSDNVSRANVLGSRRRTG
jgi:hypothetical protein